MEIQFREITCPCLEKIDRQYQSQEQTQEVRLPDTMPDIGRVLGCWGQTILRTKEWRGNGMSVSGGVMAWVLYAPEDLSEPVSVECWIPFQLRWDFPQTQRDGFMLVCPRLKAVDARSTSARKLMVRACVDALGEALEPQEQLLYAPTEVPKDVQLLINTYPVDMPTEFGEKLFDMEEDISLPEGMARPQKLLRYCLQPAMMEQKVMAGRLVFRGKATLDMLYRGEDGQLHSWQCDLPFSQYAQLDQDHSNSSDARVCMAVTALDMDIGDQQLRLRCSVAAQYVISDRIMMELVEDAYSPRRIVEMEKEERMLPIRLDSRQEEMEITGSVACNVRQILDVSRIGEHPLMRQNADMLEMAIPSQFQVLYYDDEGHLQCAAIRAEGSCNLGNDPGNRAEVMETFSVPQAFQTADGITVSSQCKMDIEVFSQQGLNMVAELQLGEEQQPDPNRPSLILRSVEDDCLWDIAKDCGTTVEAIRTANGLTQEPEKGQMLLIPVP